VGTFLRIPLADGTFGYGRVLEDSFYAFYDYRTREPEFDLEAIASKPVLFSISVRRRPGSDKWESIGGRELDARVAQPVVQFMQDLADFRKCVIFDTAGRERSATPEECVGIERAAVWEPHHVEARLLDAFEGRQNETAQRLSVRLE